MVHKVQLIVEEKRAENQCVSELIAIFDFQISPDVNSHRFVSDGWPRLLSSMGER